jgi:hypothetical protein
MEYPLRSRIKEMVEELVREQQQALSAAGTLADLEELTCHIGGEVARQLCQRELADRGKTGGRSWKSGVRPRLGISKPPLDPANHFL